jgi:tryptophan synthase beta chain
MDTAARYFGLYDGEGDAKVTADASAENGYAEIRRDAK